MRVWGYGGMGACGEIDSYRALWLPAVWHLAVGCCFHTLRLAA